MKEVIIIIKMDDNAIFLILNVMRQNVTLMHFIN